MKITVTAQEVLDAGVWDEFCEEFGLNVWAINEGRMDSDEEFSLTEEQAKKLGFL